MSDTNSISLTEIYIVTALLLCILILLTTIQYYKSRQIFGPTDSYQTPRSFLTRLLLLESDRTLTRLDIERTNGSTTRWKCRICDFSNAIDKTQCLLCDTRRQNSSTKGHPRTSSLQNFLSGRNISTSNSISSFVARQSKLSPVTSTTKKTDAFRNPHCEQQTSLCSRPTLISLRSLNPKQKYARRRKEWVRHIDAQGVASWSRVDVLRTLRISNNLTEGSKPMQQPCSSSQVENIMQNIGSAEENQSYSYSLYSRRSSKFTSGGHIAVSRLSDGFITYLVRSSVQSEGRLTFARASAWNSATLTARGITLSASDLEALNSMANEPFPVKYAWYLEKTGDMIKDWKDGRVKISVHRHPQLILAESMEQLLGIQAEHLHYPIRIEFLDEWGVDAGGLLREWFSLLFESITDESLGLFLHCHRNNQSIMINPQSADVTSDHLLYYQGIGRLIGRALLEGHTMPVHFCLPILKHFLGVPITFSDLQYVDPEVYSSMKYIRENDGVEDLALTFSVVEMKRKHAIGSSYKNFNEKVGDNEIYILENDNSEEIVDQISAGGFAYNEEQFVEDYESSFEPVVVDLKPNGRNINVTDENKLEYLHLKLRYLMLDRYALQLQAISQGLFEIIPQEHLMVFDYQELELVMCGCPEISVTEWKANTKISNGFVITGRLDLIDWFWEVLSEFTEVEKAKFLQFCTGSSRLPVQGFKGLTSYDGRICNFSIKALVHLKSGYPKVHTCFNRVELPLYEVKEDLKSAMHALLEMSEFSDE